MSECALCIKDTSSRRGHIPVTDATRDGNIVAPDDKEIVGLARHDLGCALLDAHHLILQ